MNDENDELDGSFDDPAYADISALLAGARETGPVPDDVAARLDATLAELTADRRTTSGAGAGDDVVVPLRSRRLLAPRRLLVAAAAVVVVGGAGVGIAKVVGDQNSGTTASASSAHADDAGASGSLSTPLASEQARTPLAASGAKGYLALKAFSTDTFGKQAARYLAVQRSSLKNLGMSTDEVTPTSGEAPPPVAAPPVGAPDLPVPQSGTLDSRGNVENGGAGSGAASGSDSGGGTTTGTGTGTGSSTTAGGTSDFASKSATSCAGPPKPRHGRKVRITLDGRPAVLVVHPVIHHRQLVEAWSCDGSTVLASVSLAR